MTEESSFIPAGAVVYVDLGIALEVYAEEVIIDGTLDGDGAGFAAVAGGLWDCNNGEAGQGTGGGEGGHR
jgi:hypothetical protein